MEPAFEFTAIVKVPSIVLTLMLLAVPPAGAIANLALRLLEAVV